MIKKDYVLLADTFIIGLIGAVCAHIFLLLLGVVQSFSNYIISKASSIHIFSHSFLVIFVLVIGGLLSGFLVYTFAPEAEGHGTDAVIRAFHRTGGYLRPIVVPVKILASAITIGTGGAAGKEGPTALFSAGIGSWYADFRKVTWKRRQMFVIIGMASGLSAVFKSPLGSSIFAIEVLYATNEFETRDFVYVLLGPLIAYIITGYVLGWGPVFNVFDIHPLTDLSDYIKIVFLGVISGVVAVILPNFFYYTRDFFKNLKIKNHFKPAIGALIVGSVGVFYPQVLGGGYEYIQEVLNGNLVGTVLIILALMKLIAFSFTVGSGGSGGVFAPGLFIGAMIGGFLGYILHSSIPVFTLIGMAAIFGAAARTPLATIIMVVEMTGGYTLLVPTILGVLIAHFIHSQLNELFKIKYISLYEAQLINKEFSPIYQMEKIRDILICNATILDFDKKVLNNEDILGLLESGIPVKVNDKCYLFFGRFNKNVELEIDETGYFKKYKNAKIIYIFRNGRWFHASLLNKLHPGDEVIVMGKKEDIDNIQKEFITLSKIFSKLKKQKEN